MLEAEIVGESTELWPSDLPFAPLDISDTIEIYTKRPEEAWPSTGAKIFLIWISIVLRNFNKNINWKNYKDPWNRDPDINAETTRTATETTAWPIVVFPDPDTIFDPNLDPMLDPDYDLIPDEAAHGLADARQEGERGIGKRFKSHQIRFVKKSSE